MHESHDTPKVAEAARRRRTAALAGHAGDEAAARALLADPEPSVRATAAGALARMGRLTATDLQNLLADTAGEVRRRAGALAVGVGAGVDLVPVLADADPSVAETAAWALGEQQRSDDAAMAALIDTAGSHADALVREAAVAALGAIGDERGLAAILAACGDKPAVRRRAVLALAPFDGPEVDAALQAALADRDWQVRQAAEDLLAD
jgi:HEAT repeat protein